MPRPSAKDKSCEVNKEDKVVGVWKEQENTYFTKIHAQFAPARRWQNPLPTTVTEHLSEVASAAQIEAVLVLAVHKDWSAELLCMCNSA